MSTRLEAWLEGQHAGQFVFDNDDTVRFDYDEHAPQTPISLSLPRDGSATKRAAANFLDNLLPDHAATRARMAHTYGATSTSTADLLAKAGGDVAGGLLILPEGETAPTGPVSLNPALDRDIADRINSIKLDPDAWAPRDLPARFSLAGTQGKFAIVLMDGEWYWSNAGAPSTHIIKPGRPTLRNVEAAEAAALTLASNAGVPAAAARVLCVEDQSAFIIERFDREPRSHLLSRRLLAEDLAQALGVGPDSKYDVSARQVTQLLGTVDADGEIVRGFLRQLVFNIVVGNADAHSKNYSILLRQDGVRLAPLYDVVPVGLYSEFNQQLAMRIAGAHYPQAATAPHWRKLARSIGFDEDEMTSIVNEVAENVAELNDAAWDTLDHDQATLLRQIVARNADTMLAKPTTHPGSGTNGGSPGATAGP
ncbi:HipA domain-containing protein [soil metagenome]